MNYATLKDEARLNRERITDMGKQMAANTYRLFVAPGLAIASKENEPDTRCSSCAGRLGTVPAGCMVTQSDFLKAIMESVTFMCHAHTDADGNHSRVCHAWFAAQLVTQGATIKAPWPFSDELIDAAMKESP